MNKLTTTILTIAILTSLAGAVALGQGGRAYTRRVWTSQVLTDAGASNSVSVATEAFKPHLGRFAVETRVSGTGTVNYVNVEVSQDGEVWYVASADFVDGQVVSTPLAGPSSNKYEAVTLPAGMFYRLTGVATTGTPVLDAWIILQ